MNDLAGQSLCFYLRYFFWSLRLFWRAAARSFGRFTGGSDAGLAKTTGDLAVLQMILGHRSITMTLRYAHLLTDNLHASMKKLGTKVGTTTPDHALETVA